MDPFTAGYLANLTAALSGHVVAKVARRTGEKWAGDETARALERCIHAGVLAMVSKASGDAPEQEALLADIFRDFFRERAVATEVTRLVRGDAPSAAELEELFYEAGYDPDTLPGLRFRDAVVAFEAAFLEAAAAEPALQPIIGVHQGWAQTALQRRMVSLMQQMVAALRARSGQPVGIEAGRIVAENVVSGTQQIETQVIYRWGEEAAAQIWETHYLKTLVAKCNRLDLADVDERILGDEDEDVQLSDVFTTVYAARGEQVIRRHPEQTIAEAVQGPRKREEMAGARREAEEGERLTAVSAAGGLSRLVVLGHPGGGKSTLVNYLATQLARGRLGATITPLSDWPKEALFPVRIILRRFAAWLAETVGDDAPAEKDGLVWRYLGEKLLPDWGCAETARRLKQTLVKEGGVIFFDGLDEVPERVADSAYRTLIKDAIVAFARPLDRCKVIVTCREYAYKKDHAWRLPGRRFPAIDLALFQEEQIRQFAVAWYQVMGPRREWDRARQEKEATDLVDEVLAKPHLYDLARYPLLLTLMAQVHGRYSRLPENRADLYDRAVNLLLSHWENRVVREVDGRRRVEPGLIARLDLRREEVRSVLQEIAFTAHERQEAQDVRDSRAADIGRDELWEGLLPLVGSYDRAKDVTDYVQTRAGLLQAREGFTYSFPHRTFQEYLAAGHVWSLPGDPVEALYERLERDPAWWREIFLLAAGQARDSANRIMTLVNRLAPAPPRSDAVSEWQLAEATLAAQTIHETNFIRFARGQAGDHPYPLLVARVRAWLEAALVAEENLPPVKRVEAGQALGRWLEDTRPGVGVVARDGQKLPDITWGEQVPAGTYTIGGDERARDAFRKRQVTIPHDYRLSRYPVTYAQFQCFVDAADFEDARWWAGMPEEADALLEDNYPLRQIKEQAFPYDNHPRENVSWYQALAFCRWLTDKLHAGEFPAEALAGDLKEYVITLPHEYEWEVAARWPNENVAKRTYPWGPEFDAAKANMREGERVGQTTAVGMYPSGKNVALDLYDLSGNVWEWCRNQYDEPDKDIDPEDVDTSNAWRVVRGGSWKYDRDYARSACRINITPGYRDNESGFRVVCVARRPPISSS